MAAGNLPPRFHAAAISTADLAVRTPAAIAWEERWLTPERMAEYDRAFNPPSVYDWIDPWEGRGDEPLGEAPEPIGRQPAYGVNPTPPAPTDPVLALLQAFAAGPLYEQLMGVARGTHEVVLKQQAIGAGYVVAILPIDQDIDRAIAGLRFSADVRSPKSAAEVIASAYENLTGEKLHDED